MNYEVINNEVKHQFEIHLNGSQAELVYRLRGDKMFLLHTWVPDELSGNGLAKALAEHALRHILQNNYEPVVYCPFVQAYIKRHPNWKVELSEQ